MAHLSPHEVEARLSDRFRLLSGGRRGVQRQQTLQAVIDWSHDLLSEPERVLLRRLSVFAGGWTLEAAQGICSGDDIAGDDVVQLLGSLVARSLVDPEDQKTRTRYRLLETVRLYAQDRLLAAGEADRLRAAHAAWFDARAAALTRGGPWFPPLVSVELDPEVDNLRQAIDWWRDAGRLEDMARLAASTISEFHGQARFDEVEEWLQAALAEDGLPRALRARCLAAWAIAVEMRGDFPLATQIAEEAIATAEHPSDACGAHGILVHNLAWAAPDEAERLLENAAEWAAPLGTAAAGVIGAARAIVACARHDYDEAVAHISGIGSVNDGGVFGGPAGGIVATIRILHGDLDEAESILESLFLSDERWPQYYFPLLRGIIDARRGDIAGAREKVGESVAHSHRWRVPLATADGVLGCAAIAFHAGRTERASELLACIAAATGAALRSPMSMCLYRYYRREVRAGLDAATVARARSAGISLSLEAALAAELGWGVRRPPDQPH
jgi:tetratricopeptide (TPR) repeat protein